jgi:hypothetical protein
MRLHRLLAVAVACAALLPVGASALGSADSGVRGQVRQSPGGACLDGDACDGIGRGVLLAFARGGHAHRVRSGATGTFRLRLLPGRYRVSAPEAVGRVAPASVVVPRAGYARITVAIVALPAP